MSLISFYHVLTSDFEKSVCHLIEKCYKTQKNTLVLFDSDFLKKRINDYLWTFSQKSFVPHGTREDLYPEKQPVLLSNEEVFDNYPQNLVLLGKDSRDISKYERVIVIFNDSDEISKNFSRGLYLKYKKTHNVVYYKQDIEGNWIKG